MDFITKLPRSSKKHDSIMDIVNKLTKGAHFVLVKSIHKESNIYMREIVKLHGVLKTLVSDIDPKFTSNFWKGLFRGIGTSFNFSTTYHPKSNGKIQQVNQVIEYMLRMHVMDKPSKWQDCLHLVEFSYNNGNQASLKMSPFEAQYGRKCNTLVSWDNLVDGVMVGLDMLREMEEQMVKIKQNLKVSHDKQKICTDKGKTYREFKVGGSCILESKRKTKFPEVGEFF